MYDDDHMTGERKRKGKEEENAASERTADLEPIRLEGLNLSFHFSMFPKVERSEILLLN